MAIDLIRNPGAPVLHIDDAAFPEAVLLQEVAHGGIVSVGVDADIGNPGHAVGEAFPEDSLCGAASGYPVDGAVGGIIQPLSFLDDPVGGIFAQDESEDPADVSLLFYDIALSVSDICKNRLPGGPVLSPLARVSGPAHLFSGIRVYLLNPFKVGGGGLANCHLQVSFPIGINRFLPQAYHSGERFSTFLNSGKQIVILPWISYTKSKESGVGIRRRIWQEQ